MWITQFNMQPTEECACEEEVNQRFNGLFCPKPWSCSWHCADKRFRKQEGECEGNRVYHCARNLDQNLPTIPRGQPYIEACAPAILCPPGIYRQHGSF